MLIGAYQFDFLLWVCVACLDTYKIIIIFSLSLIGSFLVFGAESCRRRGNELKSINEKITKIKKHKKTAGHLTTWATLLVKLQPSTEKFTLLSYRSITPPY